ncbi:MAG: disulfide bond formation protein B [Sphingomonas sp.]|nr:disulfide bond formation protein B [Sphingomonas sp.]
MPESTFRLARLLALLVPGLLMAGALGSQVFGGLIPCEMCHWQRWPHYTAIGLAILAFALPGAGLRRMLVALAGFAILTSGAIGVFHAGVEYHWWQGITPCSTSIGGGGTAQDMLARIMKAPIIRCDAAQWTLAGISLAGFNAIFSISGALGIFALLLRRNAR